MTLEVRPLSVHCNIQCTYCYQNPQRDAGETPGRYDLAKIKHAIEEEGGAFSLFGGEPLLVPAEDLEDLFKFGFERNGHNGIQTNATLVTDDHIRMFKQYGVRVGISLDGPGELNDARWNGSLERTREATRKSEEAIVRLCAAGLTPSLIITLSRANASPDKLPRLVEWIRHLVREKVRVFRLHLLEIESDAVRREYALSDDETEAALLRLLRLQTELRGLRIDLFDDIRQLLRGKDESATCTWHACDPLTTRSVRGVEGDGERSNCGRTNKDGINFVKSQTSGYERYLLLYATPQAFGGCEGCRFFAMCKGYCPGTAMRGDWRNRSEQCAALKALFATIEKELIDAGETPISMNPSLRKIEGELLRAWASGRTATIRGAMRRVEEHGDR